MSKSLAGIYSHFVVFSLRPLSSGVGVRGRLCARLLPRACERGTGDSRDNGARNVASSHGMESPHQLVPFGV